jgi:predicted GTPase
VRYHPGETNVRRAQVLVVNKLDSAPVAGVQEVLHNISQLNATATVIHAVHVSRSPELTQTGIGGR